MDTCIHHEPYFSDKTFNLLLYNLYVQALIIAAICENSFPLSAAEPILKVARALAADPKTLSQVRLSRTTASYKLNDGVARCLLGRTVQKCRELPFSLNVDEATSKTNKKVLSFLASYVTNEGVKVEQLSSVEVS